MREKWEIFKETLTDQKTMTKKEFLLIMAVCVLGGLVTGMLISPRKHVTIGSHNVIKDQDDNKNSASVGAELTDVGDGDIVKF